jgi:hypothetical protein
MSAYEMNLETLVLLAIVEVLETRKPVGPDFYEFLEERA